MTSTHQTERRLQPLLEDSTIVLRAPTQAWSAADGDMGARAIHGAYHGDVRHLRAMTLQCAGSEFEWIATTPDGPSAVTFVGLLRHLDDASADPKLRVRRRREVESGVLRESIVVESHLEDEVEIALTVELVPDFSSLHDVKAGLEAAQPWDAQAVDDGIRVSQDSRRLTVTSPGAATSASAARLSLSWHGTVVRGAPMRVEWKAAFQDDDAVVIGAARPVPWDREALMARARPSDPRLARWLDVALGDLDALRLALPDHPGDVFYAAGAPWFFTLFGRDSLWAARLALPLDVSAAASTLRVLARLQGTTDDDATAQAPGKIMHELRSTTLESPGEGLALPPLYYGSVDATALWVCVLVDAWRAGMAEDEVRELLPALRDALRWIVERGDHDGDGFLDYFDPTGHGLANQGWKDSGDSIQWRDGTLANGPIALCEVQGYAYEAAMGGAALLEAFGDDAGLLREWAAALRERFAAKFWVTTPEGRYPAIALDRDKRPVDSLTSNIGHLLGTGILDGDDERAVADLLLTPGLASGYGIRTLSTGAAGYWPLSYHGGSVWTHDTAICAFGMGRAGLHAPAAEVCDQMLAAAEAFEWRVPELHGGDSVQAKVGAVPYPAACRPQAWSAAAAVVALTVMETASE